MKKQHFLRHIAPQVLERTERDKEKALAAVGKALKADCPGELLDALVGRILTADMTVNITPAVMEKMSGDELHNIWEHSTRHPGQRNEGETALFEYAESPIDEMRHAGSDIHHDDFHPAYRPTYGALDFSKGSCDEDWRAYRDPGGAPCYGSIALVLPEEAREYMSMTARDSLELHERFHMNNRPPVGAVREFLATTRNPFPVLTHMHRCRSRRGVCVPVRLESTVAPCREKSGRPGKWRHNRKNLNMKATVPLHR